MEVLKFFKLYKWYQIAQSVSNKVKNEDIWATSKTIALVSLLVTFNKYLSPAPYPDITLDTLLVQKTAKRWILLNKWYIYDIYKRAVLTLKVNVDEGVDTIAFNIGLKSY